MKKLATLLLAAGLVFGFSTGASAIDFKAKGSWTVNFDYGQNGNFKGGNKGQTGWGKTAKAQQDEFEVVQRVRLQLEAVASENLSGTVHFEIGDQWWGKDDAALGADGKVVKIKHAYLDWIIPNTDAKVRMGIQPLGLPSYATGGSQIFNDDTAGVQVSYQFNDNFGATLFWARPWNDNYSASATGSNGQKYEDRNGNRSTFMDNVDMFGLSLPVSMDGVKVTPFFMMGAIGPNAFKGWKEKWDKDRAGNPTNINNDQSWGYYNNFTGPGGDDAKAGLFPVTGSTKNKNHNQYGTAWWAGLTADVTVLDPIRLALDFNYGEVKWNDSSLDRKGWLVAALAEYKMDWGTPGIVGWYASGDDSNAKNGSERMPVLGNNSTNNAFSNFAFNGQPYLGKREGLIGKSMVGTWGVGLRVKDMSFVEDLKHTFRVNYIGGTNSPSMIKRYADGGTRTRVAHFDQYANGLGADGLYMTTMDQVVELGLTSDYQIYENLKASLDVNYLITSIDRNRMGRTNDGKRVDVKDPWNINLTFMYSF